MAQIILLGTGAALSDVSREHTFLVAQGERESILVDCGGSPLQRLAHARVPLASLDHVILTHHHPDHIYGLPIFLLDLWLAGRKKVLHVYGLAETIRAVRAIMRAFEWERWLEHGFFPVEFHAVAKKGINLVIVTNEFSISATMTKHLLPTIALRFVSRASGKSAVYSSDTEVCESVVEIARDATMLFHEATTLDSAVTGHSSARQAGDQARRAGVKKLVLLHLPPRADAQKFQAAASKAFEGAVVVAKDFARYKF